VSTRRLFFALWPDDTQRQELTQATQEIVASVEGQPVPVVNYHLTLAFLGSVADDLLPKVHAVARGISGMRVDLTFDHIDYWRKPQILCAAARQVPPSAIELSDVLKRDLVAAEFAPDLTHPVFRPHVTLVRKVRMSVDPKQMALVTWSFRQFALVESRHGVYTVLDAFPLGA
jgi:RNA 2',3'-cyclic 3'-phosphodiesterase